MPPQADGLLQTLCAVLRALTCRCFALPGHFILQMQQQAGGSELRGPRLRLSRKAPPVSGMQRPPNFRLAGLAIGDGLTDPLTQVLHR